MPTHLSPLQGLTVGGQSRLGTGVPRARRQCPDCGDGRTDDQRGNEVGESTGWVDGLDATPRHRLVVTRGLRVAFE